jgi:hypothetical protein
MVSQIDVVRAALFPPDQERDDGSFVDLSADGNLEAVICDLEMRGGNATCIDTLKTIMRQLTVARTALGDGQLLRKGEG